MALEEQVIAARLAVLEENLRLLVPFVTLDTSAFISDPRNYGAAERFLQLAIESVFDIGTHCISTLGLRRPSMYADIVPTLAEASIISQKTADELKSLAGFRNLLVHDYTRIDRHRVHAFPGTRLDGLRHFAADLATYVASGPTGEHS